MLKVIIADDERNIREGIKLSIPWAELDLMVVDTCRNGVDAYSSILEYTPDIVITDIRMPKMDGLALIRNCYALFPDTKFIILSGYNDFTYAQEAIQYKVRFFLLKPCSKEKLLTSLNDIRQECVQQKLQQELSISYQKSIHQFEANLLGDALLQILSTGKAGIMHDINADYIDFQNYSFHLLFAFYLEPDLADDFRRAFLQKSGSFAYEVQPFFLYVRNTMLIICSNHNYIGKTDLIKISTQLNECDRFQSVEYELEDNLLFQDLIDLLLRKVKRYAEIFFYYNHHFFNICKYDELIEHIHNICQEIKLENEQAILQKLQHQLIEELRNVSKVTLLRVLLIDLLSQSVSLNSLKIQELTNLISQEDDRNHLYQIFDSNKSAFLSFAEKREKKHSDYINKILTYTMEHLSDPSLTLKSISEKILFMNPDYVSRQFVIQTGTKYSNYLNNLRINSAKNILRNDPKKKIYEVAQEIGLGNNPQYFSSLFKQYTGISPTEFIAKQE